MTAKLALAATLAVGAVPFTASAQNTEGTLFYTTYQVVVELPIVGQQILGGGTVKSVDFSYDGSSFSLSNIKTIHDFNQTSNADGILFAPDGDLFVAGGGQANFGQGNVYKMNTSGVISNTQVASSNGAFHLALSPNGQTLYSAGNPNNGNDEGMPGRLSTFTTNPFASSGTIPLNGSTSNVTQIAFADNGKVYYTSAPDEGTGSFGIVDLAAGTTTELIANLPAAHAIVFDPFTGNLMLSGANHITQIDPDNDTVVKSDLVVTIPTDGGVLGTLDDRFDQLSVDGNGHLFAAINNGNLLFLDYAGSGLVKDAGNFQDIKFLDGFLDDIAPLAGPGSPGGEEPPVVPLPAAVWMALSTMGLMGAARKLRSR
jgi:hypothetical protein